MLSGLHKVSSIYCGVCNNDRAIGWKYVHFVLNIDKSLLTRTKI
jgi:hypothetical protein